MHEYIHFRNCINFYLFVRKSETTNVNDVSIWLFLIYLILFTNCILTLYNDQNSILQYFNGGKNT